VLIYNQNRAVNLLAGLLDRCNSMQFQQVGSNFSILHGI